MHNSEKSLQSIMQTQNTIFMQNFEKGLQISFMQTQKGLQTFLCTILMRAANNVSANSEKSLESMFMQANNIYYKQSFCEFREGFASNIYANFEKGFCILKKVFANNSTKTP